MLFKSIALAASAAAMLIVPETIPTDGDGIFRALPIEVQSVPVSAVEQSIRVPCSQCRGRDSHLKMDFQIKDDTRLLLNGFELYPNADPWHDDLSAAVVRTDGKAKKRRLGYGLSVRPESTDDDLKLEIVGVDLRIIEVGDRFIEGVPSVKVKLLRSLSGHIMIGSINLEESEHVQCTSVWCRVNDALDDAWKSVKGSFKGTFKSCSGMRGHGHGRRPHGGRPHGKKPHHKAHGHHGGEVEAMPHDSKAHEEALEFERPPRHSWGNMLKHATSYILFPVVLGLAAGVGVALIAMAIGTFTVRLVRLLKGGRRSCPYARKCKARVVEVVDVDSEKAGLVAYQDEEEEQYQDETRT